MSQPSSPSSQSPFSPPPSSAGRRLTRILHLTDTHTASLSGVRVRSLLGKRALGYLSWRRKRSRHHTQQMLERTTAAGLEQCPDAIVLTGDLLHIGTADEMRQIRPWLQSIGEQVPTLLVPGNHDLYAADSPGLWQQELGDLPVFGQPFEASFGKEIQDQWPRTLSVGGVQIIGLSSAYPAPLTRADGRLGEAQRARLKQFLAQYSADERAMLLALHHPAEPALAAERKSLLDAAELKEILKTSPKPVAALIHGHLHQNLSYQVGPTPCYCTASASSTQSQHPGSRASFRLMEFLGDAMRCRLFTANDQADFVEV